MDFEKIKKSPLCAELLRVLRIHFGQGVFSCDYCIDRKAGYCDGAGFETYKQCLDCINKKHFGGVVNVSAWRG